MDKEQEERPKRSQGSEPPRPGGSLEITHSQICPSEASRRLLGLLPGCRSWEAHEEGVSGLSACRVAPWVVFLFLLGLL